ncbi:hypothetical protein [Rhizobium sp. WSM1325]|uniref:hypothetical protein n=1 Tax=Rhizobium sp. WSM1325 TaxID=3444086 RepID=UPI0013E31C24|nr:hypothetical protein [Rhizobium leguminosarum]
MKMLIVIPMSLQHGYGSVENHSFAETGDVLPQHQCSALEAKVTSSWSLSVDSPTKAMPDQIKTQIE